MSDLLDDYLAQSYGREVLGRSIEVVTPELTKELIADIKARLAGIDALRLGSSLASRDYVSYQNRKVLVRLLAQAEAALARNVASESPGLS